MSYRIAIDGRELSGYGGVSTYLSNLIKNFKKNNCDFFLPVKDDLLVPLEGFKVDKLKIPSFLYSNFTWINFVLPEYLKANKIDLFHSPFFTLPLIKKCKMVVTIHDVIFNVNSSWFPLKNLYSFKLFTWTAVKSADKIITISEKSKSDLVKYYPASKDKIVLIPLAASEVFKPLGNTEGIINNYGLQEKFILYVGKLEKRKNIVGLIEAFERLKYQSNIPHQLVLVGSYGFGANEIVQKISKSPLKRDIVHIKKTNNKDLVGLYNTADVFVYPSFYEGFGLPILEAFACGTPVLCSNTSSMGEIASEAAVLFNPERIEDMANKLQEVIKNEDLKNKMAEKGLQRAKDFSWQAAAQKTEEVYAELLAE